MLPGLALLPLPAVAAEWTLMGVGACRTLAGTNVTPISALRNVSWNACRQMCEQNEGCFGVEFNLRNDRSICELHGTQVKAGPSGANDRVLTCWGKDVPVVE
ncbi:MAG: PAN domain-containing protein [Rhodovulum sp.]